MHSGYEDGGENRRWAIQDTQKFVSPTIISLDIASYIQSNQSNEL
jgi:hypothetical protein